MVATSAVVKFWHVLKSKCWTWLRPILRKRLLIVIRRAVSNVSKKPLNKHFPRMSSESWLISKGLVERRFSLACFSCWAEFNGKKSLNPNPRGDIARYVSSSYSLCTLKVSQLLPSEERRQVLRILDGGHSQLEVDSWLLWKEDRQAASMVIVSKEWVKVINRNVGHSIFGDLHHGSCGFCLREMQLEGRASSRPEWSSFAINFFEKERTAWPFKGGWVLHLGFFWSRAQWGNFLINNQRNDGD